MRISAQATRIAAAETTQVRPDKAHKKASHTSGEQMQTAQVPRSNKSERLALSPDLEAVTRRAAAELKDDRGVRRGFLHMTPAFANRASSGAGEAADSGEVAQAGSKQGGAKLGGAKRAQHSMRRLVHDMVSQMMRQMDIGKSGFEGIKHMTPELQGDGGGLPGLDLSEPFFADLSGGLLPDEGFALQPEPVDQVIAPETGFQADDPTDAAVARAEDPDPTGTGAATGYEADNPIDAALARSEDPDPTGTGISSGYEADAIGEGNEPTRTGLAGEDSFLDRFDSFDRVESYESSAMVRDRDGATARISMRAVRAYSDQQAQSAFSFSFGLFMQG